MSAPQAILELIARFDKQLASYKSGVYNETQLRREFLDPFFKLLGWDIDNTAGYAEAYKDVIPEDAMRHIIFPPKKRRFHIKQSQRRRRNEPL